MLPWFSSSAISKEDTKNLNLRKQLNETLQNFADDEAFQLDLQKPMVQLAFDNWSGKALHSDKAAEIRKCSAVTSIYPRVKALELICTQTSIKTVLEHIRDRKRVLDTDALVMIFGETFVTEQGLQEDPAIQILPVAVEEEIIVAVKPDVTSSKYSSDRVEIVCGDQEFVAPIEAMPEASVNKKISTEESIPTSVEQCSSSDLAPTSPPTMADAPKAKLSESTQPSTESTAPVQKLTDAIDKTPLTIAVTGMNKIVLTEINIEAVPEKLLDVTNASPVPTVGGEVEMNETVPPEINVKAMAQKIQGVVDASPKVVAVVDKKKIVLTENNVNALREKVVETSDIVVTIVGYAIWIFIALLYSGRYSDDVTANIPWVNEANATNVVMDRYKSMEVDFESALKSKKWEVLSSVTNITIETLATDSLEWPLYVRMSIVLPVRPPQAYSIFQSDQLHITNRRVDHFFVSARTLFSGNNIRVIRKILFPMIKVFRLRALTVAIVEKSNQKEFVLDNIVMKHESDEHGVSTVKDGPLKIPKGTLMLASVSVNAKESDYPAEKSGGRSPSSLDASTAIPVDPVNSASQTSSPFVEQCDLMVNELLLKLTISDQPRVCCYIANLPNTIMASIRQSLRTCDKMMDALVDSQQRLTTMKHDVVSYFVPMKSGGTMLVAVIRTDPTGAPKWIDTMMLKMFGGSTSRAIIELLTEE